MIKKMPKKWQKKWQELQDYASPMEKGKASGSKEQGEGISDDFIDCAELEI